MTKESIAVLLKKASENEELRKELTALASRYGIDLSGEELDAEELEHIAGGIIDIDFAAPKTTISRKPAPFIKW